MNPNRTVSCGALVAAFALSTIVPARSLASGSEPAYGVPTAAQTADLTSAELILLKSGAPITVLMNPTTGEIISVASASASSTEAPGPAISNHAVCNAGDGCYRTNSASNENQGFYGGSGAVHGTWYNRSGYSAGNWTVSACWSGGCGIQIGPGSTVSLTSDVTGTSFTIH